MAQQIYLALGTNLGDRVANLDEAVEVIGSKVHTLRRSPIYETDPVGYLEQDQFLNQVIHAETDLEPIFLLDFLKASERKIGRIPTFRDGPRKIDIDILFYNDIILDIPDLHIPHARMQDRAFVLAPLTDLEAGFIHPKLGKTVAELLLETDQAGVRRYEPDLCDQC